jgi:hypothetical protein
MIECFDLRIGEPTRSPLSLMVGAEDYRALARESGASAEFFLISNMNLEFTFEREKGEISFPFRSPRYPRPEDDTETSDSDHS